MDYRTGTHAVRALVRGVPGFIAAVEASQDFDAEAFAALATRGNVREWLVPVARDPRARALLTDGFAGDLDALAEARPAKVRALQELGASLQSASDDAGLPVLFLKGLVLGQRFYGDLNRRHQYDLDVLVRPDDFERAVELLGSLGFDTTAGPVVKRLRKIRGRDPDRAPQTITVRRHDGLEIDLHCRTKQRLFPGLAEEAFWTERQAVSIGDWTFDTLSDEHHLRLLTLSLCLDLRGSAGRVKHFLDLYLMLTALAGGIDWEPYLAAREREGLLAPVATVWTMLLSLWRCADEFPSLARALEARRDEVKLKDPIEALRIVTRRRGSLANRAWFLALRGPSTFDEWRRALTVHSPALAWRAMRLPDRGEGWPWAQLGDPDSSAS